MIVALALAAAINAQTNAAVRWADDRAVYGQVDHWAPATTVGDCEDIALAKRQRLLAAGADPASVRLAVVRVPGQRDLHVVLDVMTDQGLVVLDSLRPQLLRRTGTGYQWLDQVRAGQWIEP